jgi:hypothetical protein
MTTAKRKDKFLLNERLRVGGGSAELDQDLASRAPETFKELVCANSTQTFTECNSKVGITVALIEGIIATSQIVWMMDLSSKEVQEALKDLKENYELNMLITLETEAPQGRMRDEEWRKRESV